MHLRVFLSSPGDVAEERKLAQQAVEQELPKDPSLRGRITCDCIRWDDPHAPVAMAATLTPQESVNLISRGLNGNMKTRFRQHRDHISSFTGAPPSQIGALLIATGARKRDNLTGLTSFLIALKTAMVR